MDMAGLAAAAWRLGAGRNLWAQSGGAAALLWLAAALLAVAALVLALELASAHWLSAALA